jgi:hypothetical protein
MQDEDTPPDETQTDTDSHEQHDYQTLANGFLTPRHRRLCQLAADGRSNAMIAEELGYCQSRISILLKNQIISAEVRRLQDRIFEETIKTRLKTFAEPALNNIHMILTDRTNRVKISEKMALSQWVVEKLDGKATQTHDVGENMLSVLLDKLDAQRGPRQVTAVIETEAKQITAASQSAPAAPKTEEDLLEEWITDFDAASEG